MLSTEAAATEKWCPQVRAVAVSATGEVLPGSNRVAAETTDGQPVVADLPVYAKCLGSRCAAWRWAGWWTLFGISQDEPDFAIRKSDRLGYCGLAGRPADVMPNADIAALTPKP